MTGRDRTTAEVPEHFYRQSAVLPYRLTGGDLEILLITSRRRRRWVLPKGVKEPSLGAAESAAKEALEEAGIEGDIAPAAIGSYRYRKWNGTCTVEVFPMAVQRVHEHWLENFRARQWLTPDEAIARVDEPDLKTLIRAFAKDPSGRASDARRD